jgi:hypothetical protein
MIMKPSVVCTLPSETRIHIRLSYPQIEMYGLMDASQPKDEEWDHGFDLHALVEELRKGGLPLNDETEGRILAEEDPIGIFENLLAMFFGSGFVAGHREGGGSLLLAEDGMKGAPEGDRAFPDALFTNLDESWREYALDVESGGFGFVVPPILGIILTRCARREAIPTVLIDLRNEWMSARRKVWRLLRSLKSCALLSEALEIKNELTTAAQLFAPEKSELDTHPIRILWDITSSLAAGAAIAAISGGSPVVGAVTGGVGQMARSAPSLVREFGPALFGKGAFDLAKRIRRAALGVDPRALERILSSSERQQLGLSRG